MLFSVRLKVVDTVQYMPAISSSVMEHKHYIYFVFRYVTASQNYLNDDHRLIS